MSNSHKPQLTILHSIKDNLVVQELESHLSNQDILIWHIGKTIAGENKRRELQTAIENATIIVLIVSANFFHEEETTSMIDKLLEIIENKKAIGVAVYAKPCHWEYMELYNKVIILPKDKHPIYRETSLKEKYYKEIAKAIYQLIRDNYQSKLPPLISNGLPKEPFIGLRPYTEKEAAIFFGRLVQIGSLYELIQDKSTPNIVLFCGQSGVGKSSLLAAGLIPRLKQIHWQVLYLNRNEANENAYHQLLENRLLELPKKDSRILIVLDQVEEIFTQSNTKAQLTDKEEMRLLGERIRLITSSNDNISWILSFRKEYYTNISNALELVGLTQHQLEYIEPLSQTQMLEVIEGVTEEPLQKRYKLRIEEGLSEMIVLDISRDKDSNKAPALQILLKKLWNQAIETNTAKPAFSIDNYEENRKKGVLLGDYIDETLQKLEKEELIGSLVKQGLALDILFFFTTPQITAAKHSLEIINSTYQHIDEQQFQFLLQCLKKYYLLSDSKAFTNNQTKQKSLRLGHDALAPLIQQRFNQSEAIGQQAHFILEGHLKTHNNTNEKETSLLNIKQLNLVEKGKQAMRIWSDQEKKLVTTSQKKLKEQKWRYAMASFVLVLMLGIIFFIDHQDDLKIVSNTLVGEARRLMDKDSCILAQQYLREALQIAPHNEAAKSFQKELLPYVSNIIFQDIESYKISNDSSQYIAILKRNGELILWNLQNQKSDAIFQNVCDINYKFSNNDSLLLVLQNYDSNSNTGELTLFDIHEQKQIQRFNKVFSSYFDKGYEFSNNDSLLILLKNYNLSNKTADLILFDIYGQKQIQRFNKIFYDDYKGYEFNSNNNFLLFWKNVDNTKKTGELVLYDIYAKNPQQREICFKNVSRYSYEFSSNDSLLFALKNIDETKETNDLLVYNIYEKNPQLKKIVFKNVHNYQFNNNSSLFLVWKNINNATGTGDLAIYDIYTKKPQLKEILFKNVCNYQLNNNLLLVWRNVDYTKSIGDLALYDISTKKPQLKEAHFKNMYYNPYYRCKSYEFSSNDSLLLMWKNFDNTKETGDLVLYDIYTKNPQLKEIQFKNVYRCNYHLGNNLLLIWEKFDDTKKTGDLALYDIYAKKSQVKKNYFKNVYEYELNGNFLLIWKNFDKTKKTGDLNLYDTSMKNSQLKEIQFKNVYYYNNNWGKSYQFSDNDSLLLFWKNFDVTKIKGDLILYNIYAKNPQSKEIQFKNVYHSHVGYGSHENGYELSSNDSLLLILQNIDGSKRTAELAIFDTHHFRISRIIKHIEGLLSNTSSVKNHFLSKSQKYIFTHIPYGTLKISKLQFGDNLLDYYNRILPPLTKKQKEKFGL